MRQHVVLAFSRLKSLTKQTLAGLTGGGFRLMMENPIYFKPERKLDQGKWGDTNTYLIVVGVTLGVVALGILIHLMNKRK